jgi:quinol monooxygenase YgiN
MHRILAISCLTVFGATLAPAQKTDYLDVFEVKVKPEKRADLEAICRKMVEANQKAKGDTWVTMQNEYGEGNTLYFISPRTNYAAVEQGMNSFMGALKEVYGPAASKKMGQDFNATLLSSRAELRRRRWDLSFNVPDDPEKMNKLVGDARWVRTLNVRVRPGHTAQFEESAKLVKAAYEKANPNWTVFVSQTVAGAPGINYYFTTLQPSLAAYDEAPDIRKAMGEEAFADWQKGSGEHIIFSEARYLRMMPELSNPPAEVAKASPDYWHPKAPAPAKMKAKPAEAAKAGQ